MAKDKAKDGREPLKCDKPPKEALRLAMLVKPPDDWKKRKKKAAR